MMDASASGGPAPCAWDVASSVMCVGTHGSDTHHTRVSGASTP